MKVRMENIGRGWYRNQPFDMNFTSLESFKDWIFSRDGVYDKWDGTPRSFFPTREDTYSASIHVENEYVSMIEIHQIETDEGILLSDGTYTAGQKHCNPKIRQFYRECDEKLKESKFNFV